MTLARARIGHPDEGQWQAWLDGELPLPERRELDRHWAECAACRALVADLEAAWAEARQALATLELPAVAPRRLRRRPRWAVPVAAALALVATGVMAMVPGSPLRRWLAPNASAPTATRVPAAAPAPLPAPPRATGVAVVPQGEAVEVHLWPTPQARLRIRLVLVDHNRLGVWARTSGTPNFATEAARIDVRRLDSGTVTIELPRALERFVLAVGDRPYVVRDSNGLQIRPSPDTATVAVEVADSAAW